MVGSSVSTGFNQAWKDPIFVYASKAPCRLYRTVEYSAGGDWKGACDHAVLIEAPYQTETGDPGHGAGAERGPEDKREDAGPPSKHLDEEKAVLPRENVHGRPESGSLGRLHYRC